MYNPYYAQPYLCTVHARNLLLGEYMAMEHAQAEEESGNDEEWGEHVNQPRKSREGAVTLPDIVTT